MHYRTFSGFRTAPCVNAAKREFTCTATNIPLQRAAGPGRFTTRLNSHGDAWSAIVARSRGQEPGDETFCMSRTPCCAAGLPPRTARRDLRCTGEMIGVFKSINDIVPTKTGSFRCINVLIREGSIAGGGEHPTSMSVAPVGVSRVPSRNVSRQTVKLIFGIFPLCVLETIAFRISPILQR